jgi:dihydrofolate reductase
MTCDAPDTFVLPGFQEAIAFAKEKYPEKDIFVIGGRQVYEEALKSGLVDLIYLTYVKGDHEGDVFFPWADNPSTFTPGWTVLDGAETDECTFFIISAKDPLA